MFLVWVCFGYKDSFFSSYYYETRFNIMFFYSFAVVCMVATGGL
jgi:hypothetical protein